MFWKNTLARRAVAGDAFEVVGDQLKRSADLRLLHRTQWPPPGGVRASLNNDKLVIRGGAFSGKTLDVNGVKQLANIPSEVLLAQLCRLAEVPISRTAVVLGALATEKGEGAAA